MNENTKILLAFASRSQKVRPWAIVQCRQFGNEIGGRGSFEEKILVTFSEFVICSHHGRLIRLGNRFVSKTAEEIEKQQPCNMQP